ncbi:MAG: hypothetical protein KA313_10940 [Pseudarcicella sp.]|jgi:hypothetical protein|nr:hypothetical protein [Pseudarcicella sp.]MBP6411606.1 hypothetical protein [Pseudarcicella sp.]
MMLTSKINPSTSKKVSKYSELKQEFIDISADLPSDWMRIYLDNYCDDLKGYEIVVKFTRLRNFKRLRATPEPSEMVILKKILADYLVFIENKSLK